jgi:hypothetical protein
MAAEGHEVGIFLYAECLWRFWHPLKRSPSPCRPTKEALNHPLVPFNAFSERCLPTSPPSAAIPNKGGLLDVGDLHKA